MSTDPETELSGDPVKVAILVVDDDADIRLALEMLLQYEGFEVWTSKDGEEALGRLERERANGREPGVVLADLKMPKLDGLQLLEHIQKLEDPPPVVMISGHGDVATAVEAIRKGAVNFLEKPVDENRVLVTIRRAMREQQLEIENTGLRKQLTGQWNLIGESSAMARLVAQVSQVATSDAAVLVTGENGSGKEVVARNLHYQSRRAAAPFVTVNCAAIPHELIESELFGHEKGSFTGAHERRAGHFETANCGTLFLDEIGDMPLAAQAKVLRALETHEITRVGDSTPIPVDIRVIAATNVDLSKAVDEKTFRVDLFFRLNVVPLRVPALRERREDIGPLAEHFLHRQAERAGRAPLSIAPEAIAFLQTLDWPGNVRQLRNLLEGASIFADSEFIQNAELEQVLANGPAMTPVTSLRAAGELDPFRAETFEEFKSVSETEFFKLKLAENDGNVSRTAERLGMQRSHLYKKINRYNLR